MLKNKNELFSKLEWVNTQDCAYLERKAQCRVPDLLDGSQNQD